MKIYILREYDKLPDSTDSGRILEVFKCEKLAKKCLYEYQNLNGFRYSLIAMDITEERFNG